MKPRIELVLVVTLALLLAACGNQATSSMTPIAGTPELPIIPDCNQAELVSETIPAGTQYQAGEKFDKTWIIRNVSKCDWTSQYSLVYYDGIGMGESTNRKVTENMPPDSVIHPGENATLTLNLRAPYSSGRQVGYWKLRDPSGILFMPLNSDQESLTVDIDIIGTVYSFADNLCQAEWEIDGLLLDCPSSGSNETVSVYTDQFPHLEVGGVENEPAISILTSAKGKQHADGNLSGANHRRRRSSPCDHCLCI